MNIWIRLLVTYLKCLFRPKINPTDPIFDRYIVGITEADLTYMSNARYLLFMEIARFEMMLRTRIFKIAQKNKWIPLVTSQTIRYKRPLKRFQKFTLKSRIVGWNEKWFFIEHKFIRNGKIAAFSMVKGCFRGPEGVVPPHVEMEAVGASSKVPPLPLYFTDWEKAEILQEQNL